jgi:hypothetical protein
MASVLKEGFRYLRWKTVSGNQQSISDEPATPIAQMAVYGGREQLATLHQVRFYSLHVLATGAELDAGADMNSNGLAASQEEGRSGRLWDPIIGLTEKEVEDWEIEGKYFHSICQGWYPYHRLTEDRVQWHRAWAEMMRWLEEFELKHAEFAKTINSFRTMANTWNTLADTEDDDARAAFARHRSNTFLILHDHAVAVFSKTADSQFVNPKGGDLIAAIRMFRETELGWFRQLVTSEPPASSSGTCSSNSLLRVLIVSASLSVLTSEPPFPHPCASSVSTPSSSATLSSTDIPCVRLHIRFTL